MYDERLEQLINAALIDGVLTDKERQILYRNAEAQGIDLDEFEMVLNARLVELQREAMKQPAHKSEKLGEVRKCPACGAIVAIGNAACAECGYAFTEECGSNVIDKLYERLSAIDDKYKEQSLSNQLGRMFFGGVDPRMAKAKEKINAISVFNVPNTRADLLSLLTSIETLADPKAPKSGVGVGFDMEQLGWGYWLLYSNCINKAKISFANDPSFTPYFQKYEPMLAESKKFRLSPMMKLVLGIFFGSIGLFVLLAVLLTNLD